MLDGLLLLSGNDIPFVEAQITIHQPTIKEIGYIGEENFYRGCDLLNFSKDLLSEEDKKVLEDKTNFDILIAILGERNAVMRKNRNCVELVLALIFPECTIDFNLKEGIILQKDGEEEKHYLNSDNFEIFKQIINEMFIFKKGADYNPKGDMAQKLAEKFRRRQQILAETKKQSEKKIDILSRYVSILSSGEHKDMNTLLNYTVYQLFDEFERYQLKEGNDIHIKAQLAGAKDLKEVED